MNVDSILISDFAQVTGGKLTVVGVFNRIGPTTLPARIGTLCVSLVIHAHHSEAGSSHVVTIKLLNQRREVRMSHDTEFTLTSENLVVGLPIQHVVTMTFLGPTFQEAGPYAFEVEVDGTYAAAASFVVLEA